MENQDTKLVLIENIKLWVEEDNSIKQLKKQIKIKNDTKKIVTLKLLSIMKTHDIDCFDIKDGSICYKKTKSKKQLNIKSLMSAINDYYKKNEIQISNDELGTFTKYIMNSREEVVKETIHHKLY
jgi:hypothetical protein